MHRRTTSWASVLAIAALACGDGTALPSDTGILDATGEDGAVDGAVDAPGDGAAAGDTSTDGAADADGSVAEDGGTSGECDPEAMPQPNAGLSEEPGEGGCPAGMVAVDAFCIDRFEASLASVGPGGALTPWSPFFNPGTTRVRALSLRGAVPQAYISQTQAAAACAEAGKRLCTDAEWLRACQGAPVTTYPYGGTRVDGLCNDARSTHPAIEYFGTSADWIWSMLGHPCIDQLPDSLARTDAHPECVSDEGALDMMGNLHEWTADPAGTFRGGFYVDTRINGEGCLYATTAHDVSHWDYSTGFRCCAEP